MITVFVVLLTLAAVACWLCLSAARIVAAAVAVVATHPALTLGITATAAGLILIIGSLIVVRSLRGSGWRLLVTREGAAW